jgi:hypothetical protein
MAVMNSLICRRYSEVCHAKRTNAEVVPKTVLL